MLDSGAGLKDHQVSTINAVDAEGSLWLSGPLPGSRIVPAGCPDPCTEAETVDHLAGTGLGLSIVREIAQAQGGVLRASRAPEGGAALALTLPLHLPSAGTRSGLRAPFAA